MINDIAGNACIPGKAAVTALLVFHTIPKAILMKPLTIFALLFLLSGCATRGQVQALIAEQQHQNNELKSLIYDIHDKSQQMTKSMAKTCMGEQDMSEFNATSPLLFKDTENTPPKEKTHDQKTKQAA
ncbi:hypothetical protein ACFL53_00550 [Pseudomonadota bacterium]